MSGSSNSSSTIRLERTRTTGLFYCNFFKSIRSGGGSQSWLSLPLIRTVNSLVPHLSQRHHLWTNDQFVDGNSDRPVTLALLDKINRVTFFYVGSQDWGGELPSRPLPRYGTWDSVPASTRELVELAIERAISVYASVPFPSFLGSTPHSPDGSLRLIRHLSSSNSLRTRLAEVNFNRWCEFDLSAWPVRKAISNELPRTYEGWSWLFCAIIAEAFHGIEARFPFVQDPSFSNLVPLNDFESLVAVVRTRLNTIPFHIDPSPEVFYLLCRRAEFHFNPIAIEIPSSSIQSQLRSSNI